MHPEQQTTRRLASVDSPEPPQGRGASRRLVGALAALLAVALLALAVLIVTSGDGEDPDQQALDIAASLERPLERLDDAAQQASPGDQASMVSLEAAAGRAVEDLDDAEDDIRALEPEVQRDQTMQELEDGIDASRELAEALSGRRLSAGEIQGLADSAQATLGDLSTISLPEVRTEDLVAALRRRQRQTARRKRQSEANTQAPTSQPSEPVAPPAAAVGQPSYRQHTAFGYQTQVPTGPGWGEPADSQPTPGRLFRTSVRGPAGMFVIIDYTPLEPAGFGGSYDTRQDVGQTAFGTATEYVFQGGNLPECQRAPCVDYIINDPASESGFAVLAGGSDFTLAKDIARTVMESLVPQPYGE